MDKNGKVTNGPYWTQNWIEAMWRFTAERFVNFDTGAVDFEALGREEYEFRKALFFRNFKNSPRAKKLFDEADEEYKKKVENGKQGGRPRKSFPQDAPNGNAGVDVSKSATSCDQFTADRDTSEGSQSKHDGASITRNEPRASDDLRLSATIYGDAATREGADESANVSRNIGNDQGTEDRQSQAGGNSRHTPPEVSRESGNNFESAIAEALISQRTGGHSVRRVGVARPPVRNSGRRFRNKEEYMQWAIDSGLDATDASECWDATLERGGKDADGNVVKNIKAFAVKWCKTRDMNRRKTA